MKLLHSYRDIPASRKYLVGILIVLLLANGMRLYRISYDNLTSQEGYFVALASLPTPLFFQYAHQKNIPPNIYPVILRAWYSLGKRLDSLMKKPGDQDQFVMLSPWAKHPWQWGMMPDVFWGRFLSFIFGLISILLIYGIGKLLVNRRVGIVSAILLAFSPSDIRICREITPISIQLCFLLSAFLCFLLTENRLSQEPGKHKSLKIYSGLTLSGFIFLGWLSVLVHPISLFFLALLLLWTLFSKNKKPAVLMGHLILWILIWVWEYYWNFPVITYPTLTTINPSSSWKDFLVALGFLDIFVKKPDYVTSFSTITFIVVLLSGIIFSLRKGVREVNQKPRTLFFLYFLTVGSMTLFILCGNFPGLQGYRSWAIYLAPLLCLIIAVGWDRFPVPNWKYRFLVLMIILYLGYTHSLYTVNPVAPVQEIISQLNKRVQPIDRVVVVPETEAYSFDYYYQRPALRMSVRKLGELSKMTQETEMEIPRVWLIRLPSKPLSGDELSFIGMLNSISAKHSVDYVVWKPVLVTLTCYEMKQNAKE